MVSSFDVICVYVPNNPPKGDRNEGGGGEGGEGDGGMGVGGWGWGGGGGRMRTLRDSPSPPLARPRRASAPPACGRLSAARGCRRRC